MIKQITLKSSSSSLSINQFLNLKIKRPCDSCVIILNKFEYITAAALIYIYSNICIYIYI